MKYLPFLVIFLMIPGQIIAQDQQLTFPKTKAEIIKALQFPKVRTRGIKVVPKVGAMIQFDYNSSTIRGDAYDLLNKYVDVFQNYLPNARMMIVGHTDNIGSDAFNQRLSLSRAQSIHNYFKQRGIAEKRFKIRGMGESQPIASNKSDHGRTLNRRVEFIRLADLYE
jgi:outer membrane protein OmpA-like peptidoglycan-associated protein